MTLRRSTASAWQSALDEEMSKLSRVRVEDFLLSIASDLFMEALHRELARLNLGAGHEVVEYYGSLGAKVLLARFQLQGDAFLNTAELEELSGAMGSWISGVASEFQDPELDAIRLQLFRRLCRLRKPVVRIDSLEIRLPHETTTRRATRTDSNVLSEVELVHLGLQELATSIRKQMRSKAKGSLADDSLGFPKSMTRDSGYSDLDTAVLVFICYSLGITQDNASKFLETMAIRLAPVSKNTPAAWKREVIRIGMKAKGLMAGALIWVVHGVRGRPRSSAAAALAALACLLFSDDSFQRQPDRRIACIVRIDSMEIDAKTGDIAFALQGEYLGYLTDGLEYGLAPTIEIQMDHRTVVADMLPEFRDGIKGRVFSALVDPGVFLWLNEYGIAPRFWIGNMSYIPEITSDQMSLHISGETQVRRSAGRRVTVWLTGRRPSDKTIKDVWAAVDVDADGAMDLIEEALGASASARDSDGDGLQDAQELLVAGSDPRRPDSDGDGLGDLDEYVTDHDPKSWDNFEKLAQTETDKCRQFLAVYKWRHRGGAVLYSPFPAASSLPLGDLRAFLEGSANEGVAYFTLRSPLNQFTMPFLVPLPPEARRSSGTPALNPADELCVGYAPEWNRIWVENTKLVVPSGEIPFPDQVTAVTLEGDPIDVEDLLRRQAKLPDLKWAYQPRCPDSKREATP